MLPWENSAIWKRESGNPCKKSRLATIVRDERTSGSTTRLYCGIWGGTRSPLFIENLEFQVDGSTPHGEEFLILSTVLPGSSGPGRKTLAVETVRRSQYLWDQKIVGNLTLCLCAPRFSPNAICRYLFLAPVNRWLIVARLLKPEDIKLEN